MKKLVLFLLIVFGILSCKQSEFINEIQGTWKVTEIDYIYADTTLINTPTNMLFIFDQYDYQNVVDNALIEQGTFTVNGKATQINFNSSNGNSVFMIQEKSTQNQTWISKHPIIDFYLGFKMVKQ